MDLISDFRRAIRSLYKARGFAAAVLGEGGVLLVGGLAAGMTIALLTSRLLRGLLFGVAPHDPVTLGAVALLLAAVGVAACLLPALRAARVDPAIALRAD